MTPYSQHQLNSAKKQDWQNVQDWEGRIRENPTFNGEKPISMYWKMISRRDALMEELYILGVKFNQVHEIY